MQKPEQRFQRVVPLESGSTAYLTTWKFWSSKKNDESWEWSCLLRCNKTRICKSRHHNPSTALRFFWSVYSYIQFKYRKIQTTKNSVFGDFSRSADLIYRPDFLFVTIVQLITYQYKIKNTGFLSYRTQK